MKQRFWSTAAILAALCIVGSRDSLADATATAKKAITTAYAKQSAAISKGDAAGFAVFHAPDFYITDKSGSKQTLAVLRRMFPGVARSTKNLKHVVSIRSIKVTGKTATVSAKETIDAQLPRRDGPGLSKLHAERTMTDTWVQTSGRWLRKVSRTLDESQTVDGKRSAPQPVRRAAAPKR